MKLRRNQNHYPHGSNAESAGPILDKPQGAFLGKMALGGNTTAVQRELFEWRTGSMVHLVDSLPKLTPSKDKHFSFYDLVSKTESDGSHHGVVGVVLAGDTAVAIVASQNRQGAASLVRFVELPYGEHGTNQVRAGKLLSSVDPNALTQPREDGVVRAQETITFGRSSESGVQNIGNDRYLSRNHFSATVYHDGNVSVRDEGSTNGTVLLTDHEFSRYFNNPQLQALYVHLHDPANNLEWDTTAAEHATVANPG